MNKGKLILKDETAIEFEDGSRLGAISVTSANRTAMAATWEKLTLGNLAKAQIQNGDGTVVGNYTDLVLESETSKVADDGSVLTSYHIRVKTSEEKRLDALEAGQTTQDGAIEDIAKVTSTLAEEKKGSEG